MACGLKGSFGQRRRALFQNKYTTVYKSRKLVNGRSGEAWMSISALLR